MTEVPHKRYYRADELAREMGKSVETVRRWLRGNLIDHIHTPKDQLIPHDEFFYVLQHGPRPRPM